MNRAKKILNLFERNVKTGDYVTVVSHEGPDGAPSPHSNKSGEVMAIDKNNKAMVKLNNKEKIMVRTSVLVPVGENKDEATEKTPMVCRECGYKFKKSIGKGSVDIKCPKCGGYDTDVE